MKAREIMLNGLVRQNPVLKLVLGTCSVLALSVSAVNGLGMGIAVTFVLLCSNVMISRLRNIIPDKVRIPAYIMLIATFVTIVKMLLTYLASMSEVALGIYNAMGVFLPLIVVNCIILARAESFASQNPVGLSALDGLFQGLGYTVVLTLMGIVREFLGFGTFFGIKIWSFTIGFFVSPAGAFLTYAVFIALFTFVVDKIAKSRKEKEAKTDAFEVKEEM
ncbi:MAG: electron transport complex subunit RsxE [Clostridia bacterium]